MASQAPPRWSARCRCGEELRQHYTPRATMVAGACGVCDCEQFTPAGDIAARDARLGGSMMDMMDEARSAIEGDARRPLTKYERQAVWLVFRIILVSAGFGVILGFIVGRASV